jgi:hypothetical protein
MKMHAMSNAMRLTAVSVAILTAAMSFGQGQGRGGRKGRGPGGNNSLIRLVQRPDVQADLGLSDDLKTKVAALRPARGAGGGGRGNGGGGGGVRTAPTPEEQATRLADERKLIAEVLSADQVKRLDEIMIQLAGDRAVLLLPVQTALSLTDDQKSKVTALSDKFREANQSLMSKVQSGELTREELGPKYTANARVLGEEIHKLLTAEQLTKLKALGGKPFKADVTPNQG